MASDSRIKDPNAEHPLAGAAAKSQRRIRVYDAVLRSQARLLGYERILSDIARHDGEETALEVAADLRWNPTRWLDSREFDRRVVRQASVTTGDMGPDHDPRVIEAINGNRSMQEIGAVRATVTREYAKAAQEREAQSRKQDGQRYPLMSQRSAGPGWDDDPDHAPAVTDAILRGAPISEIGRLRQQAARLLEQRAEAAEAAAARPTKVSQPPMTAADPMTGSATT